MKFQTAWHEAWAGLHGSRLDALVYAFIAGQALLQMLLPMQGDEFFRGDAIYFELAEHLLRTGRYGLDFNDVLYPPGLPALLAGLCRVTACSHADLVRAMPPFVALGLVAAYDLLRRAEGRGIAAAACLLVASSPVVFELSTRWVLSDLPFFGASMATLAVAARLETAERFRTRVLLGLACAVLLACCVLLRSAGMALIVAFAAWLGIGGLYADRATRMRRLKRFAAVALVGLVVQGLWMGWASRHHESADWPMLEGHPRSYVSQLKVKSGVRPELGTASPGDVAMRVPVNLAERAAGLSALLLRKDSIYPAWHSPWVLGPVLLIAIGLAVSYAREGAGLADWYFVVHEGMYLLWPWPYEERFLLPVLPLAGLYLWRGTLAFARFAVRSPRLRASTPAAAFGLAPAQAAAGAMLAGLMTYGIALQAGIAWQNLHFDAKAQPPYVQVLAARWIAEHTSEASVVMARQLDVMRLHAQRKVVWFAPISDARVLMQGIRRLDANFVVVTNFWDYYLPSEDDCMRLLLAKYPRAFRVAHQGARFMIYEVVPAALPPGEDEAPRH